jgi:hemerythrin-like metal-binding protein
MADIRIRWSEALAVGAAALDTDHQHLFALTNEVMAAILDGRGPEMVKTAIKDLEHYTRQHFSREEALLFETGYPDAEAHRAAHKILLGQLQEIRDIAGGQQPERVARFLQAWILDHILVSDMDYARFLRKRARTEESPRRS